VNGKEPVAQLKVIARWFNFCPEMLIGYIEDLE